MFYSTTHSTHFIYGYMASDIWLRTILIVRKETRCRHIGYSYWVTARVLLYAPSHRQDNTYHSLCYTRLEREIASWCYRRLYTIHLCQFTIKPTIYKYTYIYIYIHIYRHTHTHPLPSKHTSPDGAVVMSSSNGLTGTGFTSRHRLQHGTDF